MHRLVRIARASDDLMQHMLNEEGGLRGYLASGNASVVMAAVAMTILPVLVVFLLAQRWIIQGVTQSGIKG